LVAPGIGTITVGTHGLERLAPYGGYGAFPTTLRHSLTGEVPRRSVVRRDPLNRFEQALSALRAERAALAGWIAEAGTPLTTPASAQSSGAGTQRAATTTPAAR